MGNVGSAKRYLCRGCKRDTILSFKKLKGAEAYCFACLDYIVQAFEKQQLLNPKWLSGIEFPIMFSKPFPIHIREKAKPKKVKSSSKKKLKKTKRTFDTDI